MMRPSYLLSLLALALVAAGFSAGPAAERAVEPTAWTVDDSHSQVKFRVRHLGISNVEGQFSDYDVDLTFDPDDLSTLQTTASVAVNSIDTGNGRRDEHLRSEDFFHAEQHPKMTFVSREVRGVDGGTFELAGDLTIRGVTRPVVFDAEMLGTAEMRGKQIAAFTATTTINRHDFGLTWNRLTEAGGVVVGEDVVITLDVEANR